MKGLGRGGANAPPQMLRRCCWLSMTSSDQWHFRGGEDTPSTSENRKTLRTNPCGFHFGFSLGPADGKLGPADGKLGPADGRLGTADGRLGPADGRLGPADGRLGPADGKLGPADGKLGPADGRLGGMDYPKGLAGGRLGGAGQHCLQPEESLLAACGIHYLRRDAISPSRVQKLHGHFPDQLVVLQLAEASVKR